MSTLLRSHDDEVVELSLRLAGLLVTVRGPPERASEACLSSQDPLLALGLQLRSLRTPLRLFLQLVIPLLLVVLVCWNPGIKSPRLLLPALLLGFRGLLVWGFCLFWSVPDS